MSSSASGLIRRSVIAGSWYPGTKPGLERAVSDLFAHVAEPKLPGTLLGLISPHAGYTYSGQTAAHAYRQLAGEEFGTVVVLAPSHRAWVGDLAAGSEDAYETPLGLVSLDHGFITALGERIPVRHLSGDAEHAVEIQLPFLQHQLGRFNLVPILMSAESPDAAARLGSALAETIRRRPPGEGRTLLVASSDLHHVDSYDQVVRLDRPVVAAVAAYDLPKLTHLLMDPGSSVCGRLPILTVMLAAQGLGADQAHVLHHTNSGDVTGQRRAGQYTVGYMAAALTASGA